MRKNRWFREPVCMSGYEGSFGMKTDSQCFAIDEKAYSNSHRKQWKCLETP